MLAGVRTLPLAFVQFVKFVVSVCVRFPSALSAFDAGAFAAGGAQRAPRSPAPPRDVHNPARTAVRKILFTFVRLPISRCCGGRIVCRRLSSTTGGAHESVRTNRTFVIIFAISTHSRTHALTYSPRCARTECTHQRRFIGAEKRTRTRPL